MRRGKEGEPVRLESEEHFRVVAEAATDAIISIDEENTMLFVNPAAERIFGHKVAAMLGQKLTMLMPDYLRHVHEASLQRYLATGERHLNWTAVEVPGLHSSGKELALEVSFGESSKHGGHVFTGIIRDVTARQRTQRRQAAQYAITRLLAEAPSLSEATPRVLEAICKSMGWRMGGLWLLDEEAKLLRSGGIWQAEATSATDVVATDVVAADVVAAEFAKVSREMTFSLGAGLPGRVWETGKPIWISNIVTDANFPRAAAAAKAGLHAALSFPVCSRAEVTGVLEFFSEEVREPDEDLLHMMEALGRQIGDFAEAKRIQREREQLLEREKAARVSAEAAQQRLSFLTEASALLASSLDYATTLANLARFAVPQLADLCAIDILEGGSLKRVALSHNNPAKVTRNHNYYGRFPPNPNAAYGTQKVLRTGEAEFYSVVDASLLDKLARSAEHRLFLERSEMTSCLIVPLRLPERTIGTITLIMDESGRRYSRADLALAEELGRRAALAVLNARLYHEAQSLNVELERHVGERTEQLQQANRELESFASAVSHDLRTPLSGINGFSQALLEDYGESLDDTAKDYLARIQANISRMGQLIDDILKLSRVSRKELRLEPVDLSSLIQDITMNLGKQYHHAPKFVFPKDATAWADPGLVRIALENLLDNAWKFTSRQAHAHIVFGLKEEADERVYHLKDNGTGFDMRYAPTLFEPFQRLHSSREFTGTGIGLVTVKRVVERHGGRIWVTSRPGKGTTFFFTLRTEER